MKGHTWFHWIYTQYSLWSILFMIYWRNWGSELTDTHKVTYVLYKYLAPTHSVYVCRRKRVLPKRSISEKRVWHGHLKMAHNKKGRAIDSNNSHHSSELKWRQKQSIWRKVPVTGLTDFILSFSGSSRGSSIVLPVLSWVPSAIGLTLNMFMICTRSSSDVDKILNGLIK